MIGTLETSHSPSWNSFNIVSIALLPLDYYVNRMDFAWGILAFRVFVLIILAFIGADHLPVYTAPQFA